MVLCAQIEQEIAELDDDEKEFLEDLELKNPDWKTDCSKLSVHLPLLLTSGEDETRAWTIKWGTKPAGCWKNTY